MNRDRAHLEHIMECLKWISHYVEGGRKVFFADRKTQSAVLRELQTMAESSQRLSYNIKSSHPEISWKAIAGFRNVLVHDYLGIKLERIWDIITMDLPKFRSGIESILRELDSK